MNRRIFILIALIYTIGLANAQTFDALGNGLKLQTFYHQQGINFYLNTSDDIGNIYIVSYDTVSSSFNYGHEFSQIRLQVYNGISWLYTKPIKLYSKHTIDAPRILDIETINGQVWVCGSFDSSESDLGAGVIKFNGNKWESVDANLGQTYQDYFEVRQIIHSSREILLTGNFDTLPGKKCGGIAYYNGLEWNAVGPQKPYGFNNVSNVDNVFFDAEGDSIYIYNKNKISPDSMSISGETYKKLAVFRDKKFETIQTPFKYIGAIGHYQNKLMVLPSSNLVYISSFSILSSNIWKTYNIQDSFYATNYLGSFEQNGHLFLFFQNPSLLQIEIYEFDDISIKKRKPFKVSKQYLALNFHVGSKQKLISGNFNEVKKETYKLSVTNIFSIDFNDNAILYGTTYDDKNDDGLKQESEPIIANAKVYDIQKKLICISDNEGQYQMAVSKGMSIDLSSNHHNGYESNRNYSLGPLKDSLYQQDIGLKPNDRNDLSIEILSHSANRVKQGFKTQYTVIIRNFRTETFNNKIEIKLDPRISQLELQDFNPISVQRGHIFAQLNLASFETIGLNFSCIYGVDSFMLGENIQVAAKVELYDSKQSNNKDTMSQKVVAAFDPNIKVAHPNEIVNIEKEINYIIWFQNEGNDTAINVSVIDSFGSLFSLKDIHITGDSKGGIIIPEARNNCLIWNFRNIHLPPKKSDSTGSIGFVSFRTRLNNTAKIGDTIYNKAHIYFDYQKAVVTNNAKVSFIRSTGIENPSKEELTTYWPNPCKGTLLFNSNSTLQVELFNIEGQLVFQIDKNSTTDCVEIPEEISNGIYLIKINGKIEKGSKIILLR